MSLCLVGRTGDTKTAARQEGVPIIPYLQKITDNYWKSVGCPAEGAVFGRWMNNLKRDHITPRLKKKGMKWNGWHAFRRGLATNLHEMGVPTKVVQRVCRHADEATTKKHYIHATERGVRRGMRKLEASILREKHERHTRHTKTASRKLFILKKADVAQLVEQPIRNRQVISSSLIVGSILSSTCDQFTATCCTTAARAMLASNSWRRSQHRSEVFPNLSLRIATSTRCVNE